jgi:hypothetical protein
MKVSTLPALCEGILYFLTTVMSGDGEEWMEKGFGGRERKMVRWGVEVLREAVMMQLDGRGGD